MNDFSNNDAEPRQIKQFDADFYQAMIDTLQEGAFVIANKKFKLVNEAFCALTGCTKRALIGQEFGSFIYPQNTPIAFDDLESEPSITRLKTPEVQKRLNKNSAEYHLVVAHISGSATPIEINSQHFVDDKGQLYQIAYVKKKLIEQALNKALRSSEQELLWLINHLPCVYLQINGNGEITKASHYIEKLLGYDRKQLLGLELSEIVDNNNERSKALADIVQNKGENTQVEISFLSKETDQVTFTLSGYSKNDKDGKLRSIEFFAETKQSEASVSKPESTKEKTKETTKENRPNIQPVELNPNDLIRDPITRLVNQIAFSEHLAKSIKYARRHQSQLWVLYLNLENLSAIDRQFGDAVSNACLVHFSQRLQGFFRDTDIVARINQDQFAVLIDDYTSDLSLNELVARLQEVMDKNTTIKQCPQGFTFSLGSANFPQDGINSKDLMDHAQSMMFKQQYSKDNSGS